MSVTYSYLSAPHSVPDRIIESCARAPTVIVDFYRRLIAGADKQYTRFTGLCGGPVLDQIYAVALLSRKSKRSIAARNVGVV